MSKSGKRVKSGSGGGGAKWEQALLSTPFAEENWTPSVTFVVGNRQEDYTWIDILGAAVASGPRKLFSVISKEQLENEVKELGNPKAKKPKDVPANFEVTEPCKVLLDNNEEIPLPLLARLLKYKLLSIKTNDMKRRDQEKKADSDKDKARKGSGKGGAKDRAKSPGKGKGGGKKTPEVPSAKEGSKLRKRGEEDDQGKYIDDEPDDGASHYIIVYGYHNPHLFAQLSELGVTVESIIRLSSQDYSRFEPKETVPAIEKDEKTTGKHKEHNQALEEEQREKKLKIKKELKSFWKDVLLVLQKQIDGSKLHDIARQEYEVKNLVIPEDLEDAEQKNTFGLSMFEDVACMIYDLIDSRRQYHGYLNSLKLLNVPLFGQPVVPPQEEKPAISGAPTPSAPQAPSVPSIHPDQLEIQPQVDMRYYTDLMNCIPQESVSVPLLLHCMLEQVVATEENIDPPSEQVPPRRKDGLNTDLASYISSMAFKLALTEEEHTILSDVFDLPERPPDTPRQPRLMNCHDKIASHTQHLKKIYNFDPERVEKEMLSRLPFSTMTEIPRPGSKIARERAARLQELIHFCATGGMSQSEIDRAFKQFVFESMDLATTDPNGFIMTRDLEGMEHSAIPWDDPYPFFRGMIPKHEKHQQKEEFAASSSERSGSLSGLSDLIDYSLPGTPSPPPEPANQGAAPVPLPAEPKRSSFNHQHNTKTAMPEDKAAEKRPSRPRKKKRQKSAGSPTPNDTVKDGEDKSVSIDDVKGSRPVSGSDSKKGILRPSSRSSSAGRRSRSNSVHFEKDIEGKPVRHFEKDDAEDIVEQEPDKSTEESMTEIVDAQKRNLDQWCFAEHYTPHILLQVLRDASYFLPFMDTYYHKRDHSLMVVLHNPYSQEFQNHVDWHTELHCNLGFRNYMEYVSEAVADWNKEEEARYQAQLLAKELDKMREDDASAAKAEAKAKGRKSPRKSPSRSKSPKGSRNSSQERPSSTDSQNFVRANSLKAWKEEQDRLKAEEEEKEREKSAKRTKSAAKKGAEKDDKKSASRASGKSKGSKDAEPEQPQEGGEAVEEEKFWPFTGYDVGNNLIHVAGRTSTLFPTDGAQIRTERIDFTQGTNCVKTTVLKDGHCFCVHVLDPKESSEDSEDEDDVAKDEVEKSEFEKSEKDAETARTHNTEGISSARFSGSLSGKSENNKKPSVSAFGSLTAQLMDGMTLALSQFGPSGESADGKKYEPQVYVPPPTTPSPAPPPSPTKSKKGDKGKEKSAPTPDPPTQPTWLDNDNDEVTSIEDQLDVGDEPLEGEDDAQEEKKDEEKPMEQAFQHLYVTSPDGLNVQYYLESSIGMKPLTEEDRRLLIRQSYPYKTKGEQPCEAKRKKYALSELSRIITSEGTVVKNMMDGSIEVLYADGTVSVHTGHWSSPHSRSNSPQRGGSARSQERTETPTKKGAPSAKGKPSKSSQQVLEQPLEEEVEKKGTWTTTYPNGEKVAYKGDSVEELKHVMISLASDPQTSQSMATRDDHVITISYPDGTTIIEHADGTRITTYYKESTIPEAPEEDFENENEKDYQTQTVKFVKVECPAYATVEFNCSTSENLTIFGNGTTVNVFPDGYYMLHHYDGGRLEIDTEGTMTYYPRHNKLLEQLLPEREIQYVMSHNADIVVETVDADGNVFNVKSNGDFKVMPVNGDNLSDSSLDDKGDRKLTTFKEHAPRFFILHADGSGTELKRYQDIAEYLTMAENSPATAVLKDELPDYPGVLGITILKPYLGGPSEKLFKNYDQDSIIPPGIRCRDLTTLPPKEFKTPGPKFGTNVGQGLSVGAAVRQPVRIPILKCPNVLELRQLIHYQPITSNLRSNMQSGLKDYAEFVTQRNKTTEFIQVVDPRTDEEKIHAADLTEIGLQTAKKNMPKYEPADLKEIYEKTTAPPVPSPPPTPQPKRTKADWERDQREVAQELEGREALRKKKIPTYFDSEFGKAFLLSQAKDVDEILQQLSEDPRKDGTEAVRGESSSQSNNPQHTSPTTSAAYPARSVAAVTSVQSDRSSASPVETIHHKNVTDTPVSYAVYPETVPSRGGVRPGNPTPAHATGQGSPAPVRPENPTPVHAGKTSTGRPYNPTPKHAGGQIDSPSDLPSQLEYPGVIMEQPLEEEYSNGEVPESVNESIPYTQSLKLDVLGNPRKNPVPIPSVIRGGKPGAIPNTKYIKIEDPVRRKVNTIITAGASLKGQTQLALARGLILLPEEVDFGILKEGNTYVFTVQLKNTGVDSCRFRLKQPPPATGLRVVYKPGPVAAGMKSELDLELYAIAVGVEGESGVGSIRHDLEIVTETDVLFLPISATILTAYEYEHRGANSPKGGKSIGTKLVSTMPPQSTGIIRPRHPPSSIRTTNVR